MPASLTEYDLPISHRSEPTHSIVGEDAVACREHSDDVGFPQASTVHTILKSLHQTGNEVRLAFLDALRTFSDGNLCVELGYSNVLQYAARVFGLARSTV